MVEFKYEKVKEYFYPILPVVLNHKGKYLDSFGLLDSGALRSLFNLDVAEQLGVTADSGKKETLQGIAGKLEIFTHEIELEVVGKIFKTKIAFSRDFKSNFNILGRLDFFEHFVITFDDYNKTFRIV